MQNQLLLIQDVEDLGRSGDIVTVKPGYARNFLIPQKRAVVADKYTLRLQAKLQEERAKQAAEDRKEAEELATRLEGKSITVEVKVDPDGHMYGSVAAIDIVNLLSNEGIQIERRNVLIAAPIKTLGVHAIHLKLKEGIPSMITLRVVSEGYIPPEEEQSEAPEQE